MKPIGTYRTGAAIASDCFCASVAMDEYDDFERYSRVVTYDEQDHETWIFHEEDRLICSVCIFRDTQDGSRYFANLSEDGEVQIMTENFLEEKILGAGVNGEDSVGWGYLSDIQQIGDHLYACGYSGQVYKRWGPNDWVHMDSGLLQDPKTPMEDTIALSVINGPHENAIYAAGYQHAEWLPPKAYFFNGSQWRELELPAVAERIVNMYVESESRIWMCGSNGTLLLGNAQDGFKSLSTIDDNQLFTSVCKFKDKICLASNMGLFAYDPTNSDAGIRKVVTGLQPELQDANIVDSYDKVLWSIGPKDIARFDGNKWERIQDPDNPPIR
ncbi:hypothetical protein ACIGHN_15220 [Acidovorax sp. NPDC077693]|uniref:hypothetical protein n=1 Tax=unclassified Acidovorax TaxID=2684926 RepID=UPI0037C80B21